MKHIENLLISSPRRSRWARLPVRWSGALRSIQPAATAAAFGLAVAEAGAVSFSQQPGLWSAPSTWTNGIVPDGSSSAFVLHPLILDIDLTLSATDVSLLVSNGASISGPGVIDSTDWSILHLRGGTVTSTFHVTEIDVYTRRTSTIRRGITTLLYLDPSNTLSIVQEPGQTDGLTLDLDLVFQFDDGSAKIDLKFDPGSGLHDWAFRWKGDHDAYLTGLLGTQLTFSGVPEVDVLYNTNDNYTYVGTAWSSVPEPSVLGLLGASGLALLRRRR